MPSRFLPICNPLIQTISSVNLSSFFFLLFKTKFNLDEIVIAKYNYNSQENQELTITKNERLLLIDDTCLWWKVKRIDSDETGYLFNFSGDKTTEERHFFVLDTFHRILHDVKNVHY